MLKLSLDRDDHARWLATRWNEVLAAAQAPAARQEAVGRKNWLFVGDDDTGEVNAAFVSLLASCQMHGIEPWSYLRDLFCLMPSWRKSRVLELTPAHWSRTLERPEVQQRLDANIYRRATLGPSSLATLDTVP